MRRLFAALIAGCLLCMSVRAEEKEAAAGRDKTVYSVVKITGLDRSISYEALTAEDLAVLKKTIVSEARVVNSALQAAAKEWNSTPENAKNLFPVKSIAPRTVTILGTCRDNETATRKLEVYADRLKANQAENEKIESARLNSMSDLQKKKMAAKKNDLTAAWLLIDEKVKALVEKSAAAKSR